MIVPSLLRWFAPPELARPEFRRRARALWMMSWPFLGVVAGVLAVAVVVEPTTLWRRATTVAAVALLILILHAISRSGRPLLASWILVLGLSVIVTQRAWITGGIHAPVAVFYALFIVMAGVLLDARGGFVTAVVCFLGAVVLTAGTAMGWLTTKPGAGSALGGFVFVALAIGLALLVQSVVARRPRTRGLDVDDVRMLVHDMRSPMQVVLMHLDVLRGNIRGEQLKDVEGAIDGATTLTRITSSLLDVSRFEAGQMPVRRMMTDLGSLAIHTVNALRGFQPKRIIAVDVVGDVICNCDSELTRRIIENLLSNAMKHTPVDQPVSIVVAGTSDKVTIAVNDAGPGVPNHRRAWLFDPFGGGRTKGEVGHESSGLGLATCRLAAEVQGASIRYEKRQPHGSTFILRMPR